MSRPAALAAIVMASIASALIAAAPPASAIAVPALVPLVSTSTATCAIDPAGTVSCWGTNISSADGTTSATASAQPIVVPGLTEVRAIAGSASRYCALTRTGGVSCWGTGPLGDGSTTTKWTPVGVTGLSSGVISIDSSDGGSCAVLDTGEVRCWGGSFGTNPTTISGLPATVVQVAVGADHRCALTSTGAIWCWGQNGSGQLGNGTATASPTTPVQVVSVPTGVVDVQAGSQFTCARTSAGTVYCWGTDTLGQLGNGVVAFGGTPPDPKVPGLVTGLTESPVRALALSPTSGCATQANGAARCWGRSDLFQPVTIAPTVNQSPVVVAASGVALAVPGGDHTCAVLTTGSVSCRGDNTDRAVGIATYRSTSPVAVTDGSTGIAQVVTADAHSCLRTTAGQVRCWGDNEGFGVGHSFANGSFGSTADTSVPFTSLNPAGGASDVSTAGSSSCAVAIATGGVYCWGSSWNIPGFATSQNTPRLISGLPVMASIEAAETHVCGLKSAGGMTCWGLNSSGGLGDGTTTKPAVSVDVVGLPANPSAIAVGSFFSCAVVSGAVWCWGENSSGQLGRGTTTDSVTPAQVTGLSSGWTGVTAGTSHACAWKSTGETVCWGTNESGQLGDGTTTGSTVPVAVADAAGTTAKVVAGMASTCRLTTTGTAMCWGDNDDGQLGDGTQTDRNIPTAVVGSPSAWADIDPGRHTCARTTAGAAWCWGFGDSGQLGNGIGSLVMALQPTTALVTTKVPVADEVPTARAQSLSAPRGVAAHVVLDADDTIGSTLTYAIADGPTKGDLDCAGAHGEDCTYTAAPRSSGSDAFTFTASDGTSTSAPATVSLTITNQAPSADPLVISTSRGIGTPVVLTASDPNGDPLTFTVADSPTNGTLDCTGAACTYTMHLGGSGSDSFTYVASDGELTSAPATVTISSTNDAPTANDQALDATRGTSTPVELTGADPNGDDLTFSVVAPPTKGTLTCSPDGSASCSYSAPATARGTDSFTFTASDGELTSAASTVSITLLASPSEPTAADRATDAPRAIATPIVLSGNDPDGGSLSYEVLAQPTKGTLTCSPAGSASCSYTSGPGQTGADSFTYRVTDGTFTSDAAAVAITITNSAPIASGQAVAANAPRTATPISLAASDPNGDPVSFSVGTAPIKGSLTCSAAGSCTYTARIGTTGSDSFTFTASDGFGGTDTRTVALVLDATTPGAYVGDITFIEPENSNASARSPFVPVTLTTPTATPLTVWYHTVDGSAQAGGTGGPGSLDYRRTGTASSPLSVTIPAGQTVAYIQPTVFDDALVEGTETFGISIDAVTGGAAYLGATTGTVSVLDPDTRSTGAPVLAAASTATWEGNSGQRTGGVRILLTRPATSAFTVSYRTVDGTALAGTDYRARSGTVTFNPGDLSKSLDIALLGTSPAVGDRSLTVEVAFVGAPPIDLMAPTATVTILDDE